MWWCYRGVTCELQLFFSVTCCTVWHSEHCTSLTLNRSIWWFSSASWHSRHTYSLPQQGACSAHKHVYMGNGQMSNISHHRFCLNLKFSSMWSYVCYLMYFSTLNNKQRLWMRQWTNGLNWHLSSHHAMHRLDYTGLQLVSNSQILIQSPKPRINPPCCVFDCLNLMSFSMLTIIMPTAALYPSYLSTIQGKDNYPLTHRPGISIKLRANTNNKNIVV